MDRLSALETFLKVLDLGSLSAAARAQKISQPAVSQQMAALEALYGWPLLHRGPSGATATRAGQVVARLAQEMVERDRLIQAELRMLDTGTKGQFRFSTSQFLGQSIVGQRIQELARSHPDMELILKVEDRLVDVVHEGYDLTLRSGRMGEGEGVGRKIAEMETYLVASKEYLDRAGRPKSLDDLHRLNSIRYSEHRSYGVVPVIRNGQIIEVPISEGIVVDTPTLYMSAIQSGFGVARIPALMGHELIRNDQIEHVLPEYRIAPKPIYVVYPHRRTLTHRTRLVIETICEALNQFEFVTVLNVPGLTKAA